MIFFLNIELITIILKSKNSEIKREKIIRQMPQIKSKANCSYNKRISCHTRHLSHHLKVF